MILTAELSLYPLSEAYEQLVIDYIRALRENPKLKVKTGGMSTLVNGEAEAVFDTIRAATLTFMEGGTKAILVAKFLNSNAFNDPEIG